MSKKAQQDMKSIMYYRTSNTVLIATQYFTFTMQIAADQRSARFPSHNLYSPLKEMKEYEDTLNNPPTDHEAFQDQDYTASHLRILPHSKTLKTARKV